jgi:hypothetical protein
MVNTVGAPAAPGVTAGGLNVAVAPSGSPRAESATTLSNAPPTGGTVTLISTIAPWEAVTGAAGAVTVKAVFTLSMNTFEVEPEKPALPE